MGLHAMDVQNAFGDMPTVAARRYGDAAFTGMMMSKVYVMHLLVTLGYNVLFQDVDVVWYQDPLAYFNNDQSDFDLFFQDDGAHCKCRASCMFVDGCAEGCCRTASTMTFTRAKRSGGR
jgi:hypothetical protein